MKSNTSPGKTCPICQQSNFCQVDDFEHCWCRNVTFDKQMITQQEQRNSKAPKSCICQRCAKKASTTTTLTIVSTPNKRS